MLEHAVKEMLDALQCMWQCSIHNHISSSPRCQKISPRILLMCTVLQAVNHLRLLSSHINSEALKLSVIYHRHGCPFFSTQPWTPSVFLWKLHVFGCSCRQVTRDSSSTGLAQHLQRGVFRLKTPTSIQHLDLRVNRDEIKQEDIKVVLPVYFTLCTDGLFLADGRDVSGKVNPAEC